MPFFFTNHQPLSSFSTTSTISSFSRDISPSCPWNAYLALYCGTSGFAGGGGGGGGAASFLGGAGGARLELAEAEDLTTGGIEAGVEPPGRAFTVGLGLDVTGV
jgi:hypothetical protein